VQESIVHVVKVGALLGPHREAGAKDIVTSHRVQVDAHNGGGWPLIRDDVPPPSFLGFRFRHPILFHERTIAIVSMRVDRPASHEGFFIALTRIATSGVEGCS
jgi:hypothetical protein